jgi:hypothetical protein
MKEITIANEKMLGKTIFDTACDDILQTEQTKPGKRVASGSKFVSTKRRQALTADRRTSFDSTCLSTATNTKKHKDIQRLSPQRARIPRRSRPLRS